MTPLISPSITRALPCLAICPRLLNASLLAHRRHISHRPLQKEKKQTHGRRVYLPHGTRPEEVQHDLKKMLMNLGVVHDIPHLPPGKADLTTVSHLDPKQSASGRRNIRLEGGLSLREITSRYIFHAYRAHNRSPTGAIRPALDLDVLGKKVFNTATCAYLHNYGCTPEHVMLWAWILVSPRSRLDYAYLRLSAVIRSSGRIESTPPLPPFLISFLLRRKQLGIPMLSTLERVVKRLLVPVSTVSIQDSKTKVVLMIRYIRKLREAPWVNGFSRATQLLLDHVLPEMRKSANTTTTYNRFLSLIGLQVKDTPFRSVQVQQDCQFAILRQMIARGIHITREGFRALISVQLAHPKTEAEKKKARESAITWPPWPDPKDGWGEALVELQSINSRARTVIEQMSESGIPQGNWELVAKILSGQDTDRSPTTQTRSFANPTFSAEHNIWTARIKATRTLQEAWHNFLEYRNSEEDSKNPYVWFEMFEKIVYAEKLVRTQKKFQESVSSIHNQAENNSANALFIETLIERMQDSAANYLGGGKDVLAPPQNPAYAVHVELPPPTARELYSMMLAEGIAPTKQLAILLVALVEDHPLAVQVLSDYKPAEYRNILTAVDSIGGAPLKQPEPYLFNACLRRFCIRGFLDTAIKLLTIFRPAHRACWITVLEGIVISLGNDRHPPEVVEYSIKKRIFPLYREMELVCKGVNNVALQHLATAALRARHFEGVRWAWKTPIRRIALEFQKQYGLKEGTAHMSLPLSFSTIHTYIRAMAYGKCWDRIEEMVGVFVERGAEMEEVLARRCLVAVRTFLEKAGEPGGVGGNDKLSEEELVAVQRGLWERLRRMEEVCVKTWGWWPSEADVEKYWIWEEVQRITYWGRMGYWDGLRAPGEREVEEEQDGTWHGLEFGEEETPPVGEGGEAEPVEKGEKAEPVEEKTVVQEQPEESDGQNWEEEGVWDATEGVEVNEGSSVEEGPAS